MKALREIATCSEQNFLNSSLLSNEEYYQLKEEWNSTSREYPAELSVQEVFENVVQRYPDAVAVSSGGDSLSYKELNERANQLANALKARGVTSNVLIGVCIEKSIEIAVAILGIIKAGGAYVPLDPNYPKVRIQEIIDDSKLSLIVTGSSEQIKNEVLFNGIEQISVYDQQVRKQATSNLIFKSRPNDALYVIYTSGSTGKPKGVVIEHQSLVNHCYLMAEDFGLNITDNLLQFASISFDVAVEEMFLAWFSGANLVIPQQDLPTFQIFNEFLEQEKITVMDLPTAFWHNWVSDSLDQQKMLPKNLRIIIIGGEKVTPDKMMDWNNCQKNPIRLLNCYGPTEATITTTYCDLSEWDNEFIIPIGKPISNYQVYVLNSFKELVPTGTPGELYIGGVGLAREYYGQPELTAKFFIPNIFSEGQGRLYRTGDIVRTLPDGNIEYLYRSDQQVKVRGYRIELGEIEAELLKHPSIREVVVLAIEESRTNTELCVYFSSDKNISSLDLRNYLKKSLPSYMIPGIFINMEKFKLTINGKIDRKALPAPGNSANTGGAYLAPQTEIEHKLVPLWEEVLNVNKIGIVDDFFTLGGHSLNAMSLVAKIRKKLQLDVSIKDIFKNSSIKELALSLEGMKEKKLESVQVIGEQDYYPSSSAQKSVFFLHEMERGGTTYNIPHIYKVKGKLDREKAECCLQKLVQRHEALRTSFQMIDGEPFQFVQKGLKVECEIMEINESFTYECVNRIVEEFIRRFELSKAPLIRMATLSLNKEEHILMFDMHHIISDGISIELFMSEFVSLYEGKSLEELRLQYKDYSTMQNNWFHSNDMKGQSSFWMKQLEGELPILDLPLDYTRPLIQSFKGSVFTFDWNETLTIKLKELAKNTNTTLYMVLLAIYQILLSKYSGQEDILVGTPVSGRSHVDFDNIIGMFVNTMVMRNRPSQDKTFLGFLGEVRDNVLGVYGNMDFPFEVLVEQLKIERDASRNIVFDTMFAFQNKADSPWMNLIEENLSFEPYEIDHKTSKFDLTLQVIENNDTLSLSFEYNTDLFKKETIESMALHIKKLTQSILAHPDSLIRQINMTTNQDQLQLEKFNNTKVILQDKTIIDLFEEQVERTPNQIAVIVGERSITYKELNKKANQLASTLMNNGVRLNDYVGLLIENSIEMAIGILGTLKAGGAYVPIDPDYPQERIDFMIKNGNLTLLLKQSYLDTPLCMKCAILNIDEDMNYQGDGSNLNLFIPKDAVAYIIYTSGTTGRPKGVVIEHDGIYNTVQFRVNNFKMNSSHKALQLYFFAFDGFIVGFFTPLASGSTVVLLPQEEKMNLLAIKKCITNLKITHITCVPSLYLALLEHLQSNEVKNLQMVLMGGEKILPDLVKKSKILDGNIELVNEYGPSENSVSTTICRELQKAEKITIGCPINNTQIFILNSNYQVQPIGVPGELCITGKGLAKGYLNQPDLTAEKFIHHPTVSKKRLYRTGDLARWLSDGTIEYLGRLDEQVKIRGYRIELGEIESRILEYDAVKECTIVEQKTEDNQAYLCAYIVFNQNEQKPDLRNALKKVLPYYMVPTHFIGVEKIPLSANGKINKKALPIPIQLPSIKNYEPPQSLLENDLTILWEEVLKIKNIGINDDFFELGGNSLKALSFLSKMKETKNIEMRFSTFIKNTTIKNLAEFIEEEINRISTSQSDLFLTLFNHSGNPNVFCFPPIGGSSAVFTPLSEYLTDYSVYGFDFIPDTDRLHKYVDAILEVQPEGEVKLLGYSAGGNLVFEVAKVLIQRGCLVSDLIFLDSYPKSELGHNQKGNLSVLLENLTDSDGNRIQNELTQESIRMIEKYLHYFNKLVNKGIVYSNIHLIKAEDNHPLPSNQIGTWREATTRKYVEYRGRGSHFKMLDADYLKHNIALVREILDS